MTKPFAMDRRMRIFVSCCGFGMLAAAIALTVEHDLHGALEAGGGGLLIMSTAFVRGRRPVTASPAIVMRPWQVVALSAAILLACGVGYAICVRQHCGC
jgi:hypothetical protein